LVNGGLWSPLVKLFADGLHGFQVGREVPCGDVEIGKRVEKGYLDLLLLDPNRKLAVNRPGAIQADAEIGVLPTTAD